MTLRLLDGRARAPDAERRGPPRTPTASTWSTRTTSARRRRWRRRGRSPAPAGFDATLEALHEGHFTGGEAVTPPVTVAWGDKDKLLLPRQAERARRAIPQARHVWLPGCGHVPMVDDPEITASAILTSG